MPILTCQAYAAVHAVTDPVTERYIWFAVDALQLHTSQDAATTCGQTMANQTLALWMMPGGMARILHFGDALCAGQSVSRAQKVHNMEFYYQPPPRNVVPHAAALKGQQPWYTCYLAPPLDCKPCSPCSSVEWHALSSENRPSQNDTGARG